MRYKFLVSVISVASLGLAGFINPTAALAVAPPSVDGSAAALPTCSNPPDDPDATPENRDRFVELWSARFADQDWATAYAKLAETPSQILAEGFHDMSEDVQVWLEACLLDDLLAMSGKTATAEERERYLVGQHMLIFGKKTLEEMRESLTDKPEDDQVPPLDPNHDSATTAQDLADMSKRLVSDKSLTSADQPKADVTAPEQKVSTNSATETTPSLQQLLNAPPVATTSSQPQTAMAPASSPSGLDPHPITQLPLVPLVLAAVDSLLQLVATIQGVLFTLPVVNVLAAGFYKICAESPTMPLKCSISLPVGVGIPADVTGDDVPDVLGALMPVTNVADVGAKFQVTRLNNAAGPLPAHVFAVYDTPGSGKKRIQVGFDGRASTLAYNSGATFTVRNVLQALAGDVQVRAVVTSSMPGSTEALTFAVKSLIGGSAGNPPTEADPLAGSVQMNPFPEKFWVNARLTHTAAKDQDTFQVESTTPTRVDAVINQATTTTTPKSNRQFTATVDKLPQSVLVDLVRAGEKQSIDYTGSAPINLVRASDTATPNVSQPGSFTESIYEVKGVPTRVHVDLLGGEDIAYNANATVPEVGFSTRTLVANELQQRITAKAHGIPKSVHVVNTTTPTQTAFAYDADSNLADVELTMFDLADDKTDLRAKATSIPTHMEFVQHKDTGVYDFAANAGIGLIEATLTRNDGLVLPMPGDHATIYKRDDALGVDFRLSGFKSAHFDGSEDTTVEVGLSPGGQTFDVVADLDDPNVLATAHVGALPADMKVTLDPDAGEADYEASSIIPLLSASFTDRDTEMFGNATLTDLPKNIGLTFNTTGDVPEVTYDADSRLGSIDVNYSEKPGGLALHGLISDLPQYMKIGGIDPIEFDARTGPLAPKASSHLGQIFFQYATDGTFASPPTTDDHVYLDTDEVDSTHAELLYTGLKYLGVDTSNEELHATIKNASARLLRAYLTTPTLSLTGFIDKVPAQIDIAQVGNLISYDASSTIDEISTNLERANGDQVAVQIQDVPDSIDLLFDGAASELVWDASSTTGLVSALAHLTPDTIGGTRTFDAGLTITDIPVHWDASWADGNVLFQAPAPGIGSISAKVTNHGAYHVLPGDHLSAYYVESSEDLDASLKISNLRKAQFTKLTSGNGGGFEAALHMGNQGTFKFAADVTLAANVLKASGQFDQLPSQIDLKSSGGRITYSGNSNPDLTVSVEAGAPAALAVTPAAPFVHGVSVRDGISGGQKAVKAKLYLTGLPDNLDLNSPAGTYAVNGYHPTIGTLVVDAVLTTLAPQPLSLQVQQGVPTASPVDFTFGPFLTDTLGDGSHTVNLNYTASQTLGSLNASATYGNTDEAKLMISEIPSSINVNAAFGAETKTVGISMAHGIADITAAYKKVGDLDFAASVHLHDVPSAVNLAIGRAASGDGTVATPDFTLSASSAGLDIAATATAAIADPVSVKAAMDLMITNMGNLVTGQLDGTTLKIDSAPATESFALNASALVDLNFDLGFTAGPIINTGSLDVNLDIHKLTLGFENASSLQLDLGITTGLKGNYSSFTFGIDSTTKIVLQDTVRVVFENPISDIDTEIFDVGPVHINLNNVISHFRLATNRLANIFSLRLVDIGLGYCDFEVKVRPSPHSSTSGSSFTVGPPPSDGSNPPAWLITPNPNFLGVSVPDFIVDIVMFFTSPYGNAIDAGVDCESRI